MLDVFKLTNPIIEMSLTFLSATNRLEGARAMQIYTFLLHVYPDHKWTVSSLADAADRDRVSVRKQLSLIEDWFEDNDWRTLRLNKYGQTRVERRVKEFYRYIDPPYRSCLAELFKDEPHRLIEICELGIKWDALSRKTKKSQSFLAVYASVFLMRQAGATSAEVIEKTYYSKQSVHRTLKELECSGYIKKSKDKWVIRTKGHLMMFPLVSSALAQTDTKTILKIQKLSMLILKSQKTHKAC